MRIAQVAPPADGPWSGIITALVELAVALSRRGHDVEVWQVNPWDPERMGPLLDRLASAGAGTRLLDVRENPWHPLPTVALNADADLVHLHSVFVRANTAVARAWQGPYLLSPHGGYDPVSLRRRRLRKRVYGAAFERRMVRRAALVPALTEVEADQVRRFAGPVATAVIPNGVVLPDGAADGTAFRRELGVPPAAPLAVFVGRLDVLHKGLDVLVGELTDAPSWHVAFVGPDHRYGRRQLMQLALERRVGERVSFLGPRTAERLAGVYAAADLLVLPSRWEGLPMVLLEALAHGTPALVSPQVEQLVPVAGRGAGWVGAPGRYGATLEALATLSAVEWSAHGAAARALAAGYGWDAVAAYYEQACQTVLAR